jgi:hypothetical protein
MAALAADASNIKDINATAYTGGVDTTIITFENFSGGTDAGNVYVGVDLATTGVWSPSESGYIFRGPDSRLTVTIGGKGNNDSKKLYKPEWEKNPIQMKQEEDLEFRLLSVDATCEDWNSTIMQMEVRGFNDSGDTLYQQLFEFNTLNRCELSNENKEIEVHHVEFAVLNYGAVGHPALDSIMIAVGNATAIRNISSVDFTVCPNPVRDLAYVNMTAERAGMLQIAVMDVTGRQVRKQSQMVTEGANHFSLDLKGMKSGIYYMTLSQNGKNATAKIMVQ